MPTPPLKRPAAHGAPVKAELLSPAAKKKPGEGKSVKTAPPAPPEPGEGEAEVPATPEAKARASPKPKTSPCRVKLSPKVLAKVKAKAKAKAKAKPGEGTLAPVPRDAWKDVHYQLKSLEKAGKSSLKKSFQASRGAGTTTSSCWTLPFPRRRSTRRAWRRHQQKTVYPGMGYQVESW